MPESGYYDRKITPGTNVDLPESYYDGASGDPSYEELSNSRHSSNKVYVDVTVEYDSEGNMYPRSLVWTDGRTYEIDRLVSMRPSFSQKAGGQGDLYLVRINGRELNLFFERSTESFSGVVGRWFVARHN